MGHSVFVVEGSGVWCVRGWREVGCGVFAGGGKWGTVCSQVEGVSADLGVPREELTATATRVEKGGGHCPECRAEGVADVDPGSGRGQRGFGE